MEPERRRHQHVPLGRRAPDHFSKQAPATSLKNLPVNSYKCIGYKNIPVSIDDAPKAVQGERNVVTTISARSAQRI